MVLKNSISFVLISLTISLQNEINAQIVKCDFNYISNFTDLHRLTNTSAYSCNLDTNKANFIAKITKIDGQHLFRHNDMDVKHLINILSHKLNKFSSIFCQKFPNLKLIRIADAELESIDEDSLMNCKNLKNLLLNGNKIRELPDYLLIRNSKLIRLWIWDNKLTRLPENLFLNQQELKILELQGNEIKNLIDTKWMANLRSLRRLGLNSNQIEEVPSKTFESLGSLDQLWMYDNKISILHPDSFGGLQNLELLSLSKNELSDLPAKVFAPLVNLKTLYLSYNKLASINSKSFGIHNHFTAIDLQDNKINSIDPKFIDNSALAIFNMKNNVCSQMDIKIRNEVKLNLKKCFDNFQFQTQSYKESIRIDLKQSTVPICGRSKQHGHGNIIGGTHISSGDFPWIAALMTPAGKFFCGGTLVSSRKVITAAHCIQEKRSIRRLSATDVIVVLGSHDLNQFIEIGRTFYAVYSINVHPDWNTITQAYDVDIAVLVLEKEVTFNEYIQPICLNSFRLNNAEIVSGAVVGYGKSEDETKAHENIPKILDIPIHNNNDCFSDNEDLALISSGRTFCGGSGKGVGVCTGDSGSGLVISDDNAYYLIGIVSSSLLNARRGCDVDTYAVFTDVLKFVDWINGIPADRFAGRSRK